jgi:hypothetical protein
LASVFAADGAFGELKKPAPPVRAEMIDPAPNDCITTESPQICHPERAQRVEGPVVVFAARSEVKGEPWLLLLCSVSIQ